MKLVTVAFPNDTFVHGIDGVDDLSSRSAAKVTNADAVLLLEAAAANGVALHVVDDGDDPILTPNTQEL
jgi:hypothetical protein